MVRESMNALSNIALNKARVRWEGPTEFDTYQREKGVVHDSFGDLSGGVQSGYGVDPLGQGDLVQYLHLDEDSGTTFEDISGNANDGTLQGTITLGASGILSTTGLQFTGQNPAYIETTVTPSTNGAYAFWVRPTRFYNYNTLFDNTDHVNNWEGWIYDTGELSARGDRSAGRVSFDLSTLNGVDAWYHVVFSWDSGSSTCYLYVNGVQRDTNAFTYGTPGTHAWGPQNSANNTPMEAYLDAPMIFSRTLTERDAALLYEAGPAVNSFQTSSRKVV